MKNLTSTSAMLSYSFCMYFCKHLKEHNLQLWMLNKYVLTFKNVFLLISIFLFNTFMWKIQDCKVSRGVDTLDNLSFERTIQVVHMNKINTTTILEKYKMFPKRKAKMNIPLCRMISMLVVYPTLKIWCTPNALRDSKVSPKLKTAEGQGVEARSLICNTIEG